MWAGRHVVLGVSGGIACYKSCILARRLTEAGAAVDVVLTAAAAEFVRPVTFEALTGRPVLTSLWEPGGALSHLRLGQRAEFVVDAVGKFAALVIGNSNPWHLLTPESKTAGARRTTRADRVPGCSFPLGLQTALAERTGSFVQRGARENRRKRRHRAAATPAAVHSQTFPARREPTHAFQAYPSRSPDPGELARLIQRSSSNRNE